MGTTNILDLNNRLTEVEKNVAPNSYTSLKNKPKINNVTLTGNKTLADIGAAAAADLEDIRSVVQIGAVENITQTAKTLSLSEDFNNFVLLVFTFGTYGNVEESMTIPASYFNTTNITRRPMLAISQLNNHLIFYKDTNTTITVQVETNIETYYRLTVYGVIRNK